MSETATERPIKFGTKVEAYAGSEERRVGFVVNPDADGEGKFGVQVGGVDDVYALNHDETAEAGNRGGTFRRIAS